MVIKRIIQRLRTSENGLSEQLPSGVHDVAEMQRILTRERVRTDRSGESFSMLKISATNEKPARPLICQIAEISRRRCRLTDEVGILSDSQLGLVLPATAVAGAWKLSTDLSRLIGEARTRVEYEVYCYPSDDQQKSHDSLEGIPPVAEPNLPSRAMEPMFTRDVSLMKRLVDILGSGLGLIVLSPLFVVVAIAIKYSSPGPVFFRQLRSGQGGKPFWMWKFRTMDPDAERKKESLRQWNEQDGPAFKITKDPRVTKLGRFLRTTSIDELPQLWNVLRGEMSLVGPRPLPCDEAAACLPWQQRRLDVRPGVTCIWQVRGRSRVTFAQWVRMDVEYIENRSFWQEVKILLATLPAVILRRGAR